MHHKMELHLAYVLNHIFKVSKMCGVSQNCVMGMDTLPLMLGTQGDGQHAKTFGTS
jgi:hypothetical protein